MRALPILQPSSSQLASVIHPPEGPWRHLYHALLEQPIDTALRQQASDCLEQQLAEAAEKPCDLPQNPDDWQRWMEQRTASVGEAFQAYREERQAGAPRRYFQHRAHALHFLRSVAPTKRVDGAWLYGLLARWRDPAYHGLIRIYLEELGGGRADKNHVLLYRQLLARHDCADEQGLDDACYQQGVIQLALAWLADDFLPELIGFNLGYEQLPLHLPISAFELAELGLDPYYFTLHVTVDNAASGHARMAIDACRALIPAGAEGTEFLRRVRRGYLLNEQGPGTLTAIAGFDHEQTLVEMLTRKAEVGRHLHADHCRIEGRGINQWLADGEMGDFLAVLQRSGWIRRGQDATQSRFWRLIEGERAQMFGVFNGYERQLLRDWIETPTQGAQQPAGRPRPFVAARTLVGAPEDAQSRALASRLARPGKGAELVDELIDWMSPARHHSPTGLLATREFSRLLGIPA